MLARFPDPLAFAFYKSGLGNLATNHHAGLHSEVEFVHAVTAGGSVKFLPAV